MLWHIKTPLVFSLARLWLFLLIVREASSIFHIVYYVYHCYGPGSPLNVILVLELFHVVFAKKYTLRSSVPLLFSLLAALAMNFLFSFVIDSNNTEVVDCILCWALPIRRKLAVCYYGR